MLGGQVQLLAIFAPDDASVQGRQAARPGRDRFDTIANFTDMGDFVPGYEASVAFGVCAPKAAAIVDKLNAEINDLANPNIRAPLCDDSELRDLY